MSQEDIQSRAVGRFLAANYGLWSLPISVAPAGTGSQVFYLSNSTVTLPDGRVIMPFDLTAPVFVGKEQVTLTDVGTGCVLNSYQANSCGLTATFVDSHNNSETVSSASFGLQEALNDAGASGGGVVTIDSFWTSLGGTDDIVSAATVPANVSIEDVRLGVSGSSIGGSGTAGYIAQFSGSNTLANSSIDYGVSTASALTLNNTHSGGIHIVSNAGVKIGPLVSPSFMFSVAGTPLPDPTTVPVGTEAFVSDAVGAAPGVLYTGGGSTKAPVYSNGTSWYILSAPSTQQIEVATSAPYTLTSDDVAAGFVDVAVSWPKSFADTNYSIAYSIIHSGTSPAYDVAPADISTGSILVSGFTAGVYLNSGDSSLVGNTVSISAIGIHA